MSHFLDRLTYFTRGREPFAGSHGEMRAEDRTWEEGYRARWQHDKIVRSTHGVNCTGGCSWKIYVKGGIVTWETQQTDYPRSRPGMPNHEPRGCARGASYSWYLYSANRLKHPMVRGRLVRLWREARKTLAPVEAWASIVEDPAKAKQYKSIRGRGGFVRVAWDEATEIVAAANIHTIKRYGPDRVCGFSPIPAMSMVSHASGARYLSLIGGSLLSFYDWYCDLPPSSPQVWGEQTDVPESADWYNAQFIIAWGSNVPQTRTPDAHFLVEGRYNGTRVVAITPDYSEVARFGDVWLHPKQGTDAAIGMAMGHVILKEFHVDRQVPYFDDYGRRYTDLPLLVRLRKDGERYVPDRYLRASDFADALGQRNSVEWKTVGFDELSGAPVAPQGSIGHRWGKDIEADLGKWNLEQKNGADGRDVRLAMSLIDRRDEALSVAFPYFGGTLRAHFPENDQGADVLVRKVPARRVTTVDGDVYVATVFDLMCANYGVDRGLGDGCARSYDDDVPYTPKWQEKITGVDAASLIAVAREFAQTAEKTRGRSMIIIGAGVNHWYHQDMIYRGAINMLMLCGCVGVSGGGWAHYVGQEKLRPQTGWQVLAFATDWIRPPRHMNGTSFFYAHSDQWRYEKIDVRGLLSPLADPARYPGSMIDFNVRSERMGWLPSAPQLGANPLEVARAAARAGMSARDYVAGKLQDGSLKMACEDPDNPINFPRNLFLWRSNLLGSSGKGHEYMLRHLMGAQHGLLGPDLAESGEPRPQEVAWHDAGPGGQARSTDRARFPHVDHVPLCRRSAADCDLVREERPQHDGHASVRASALGGGRSLVGSEERLGNLQVDRPAVLAPSRGAPRRRAGHRAAADHARFPGRDRAGAGCQGLEARRMRIRSRRNRAQYHRRRARLSEHVQALHRAGSVDAQARQWLEGHHLADGRCRRRPGRAQPAGDRRRTHQGAAEDRQRHRRRRDDPLPGAGNQRAGRGRCVGRDVEADRAPASPPGADARGREDPLPRHPGAAAQGDHVTDVVGHRQRGSELHVELYQRQRADSVAHPHRAPAVYQDHRWMRDFGEALCVYKPPVERAAWRRCARGNRTAIRRSCSISSRRTRSGASIRPTPTT